MDWRWKAFAAKVDPAQLKSSVVEYLLPRLEIGLAHANITNKMCDAWMSTIIYTICQRAGMRMMHSINKSGFCTLAGIPDIWLRMQTARATELLVSLNTNYCFSDRSTRARFCSIVRLTTQKMSEAVQKIAAKNEIYAREHCRIASTIRYLKKNRINITNKEKGDHKPLELLENIQKTLISSDKAQLPIVAYTEGSTNPKAVSLNSGAAIIITDGNHKLLWSGGLIVRSDKNNFIAELASAAIVIKACPPGLPMILRMDSKAAIGAISKGALSERKRIRAAGRPWLNFCRKDFMEKRHHIHIEHVPSHTGTITAKQCGNHNADIIANEYRRQGELGASKHYFTQAEEQYVVRHDEMTIQGDLRTHLKSLEKLLMLETWKAKAPKQAQWTMQYPTQILKQSKRVWRWSIELGKGSAWVYYIFAICQWLPTNHRINYQDKSGYDFEKCKLCRLNMVEDIYHILTCPALFPEQLSLYQTIEHKLREWHVPYADKLIQSQEDRTCQIWFRMSKQAFSDHQCSTIGSSRLWSLIKNYWCANQNTKYANFRALLSSLKDILARPFICYNRLECCRLPCRYVVSSSLLPFLCRDFIFIWKGTLTLYIDLVFLQNGAPCIHRM